MKLLRDILFFFFVLSAGLVRSAGFADLAVYSAKEYFGGYVAPDASLEKCVAFLNGRGVTVSIFDLIDQRKMVTQEDFARMAGQSKLLFLGEAEYINGCIRKPLEAETWVDYCRLNDIHFEPLWNMFAKRTAEGPLQEVQKFFKNNGGDLK